MNHNPPHVKDESEPDSSSNGSISLLVVGLVFCCVAGIVWLLSAIQQARESARRTQCQGHFCGILLALHNYQEVWGSLPPASTSDSSGRRLHSWRTLILPYLGESALYESIDLTKPWNDPVNAQFADQCPRGYRCPSVGKSSQSTQYLAVVGEHTAFHPTRGRKFDEMIDRQDETVMVIEVPLDYSVHWMSPDDSAGVKFLQTMTKTTRTQHTRGVHGGLVNGSTRLIDRNTSPKTLAAIVTIDGREIVEDW